MEMLKIEDIGDGFVRVHFARFPANPTQPGGVTLKAGVEIRATKDESMAAIEARALTVLLAELKR